MLEVVSPEKEKKRNSLATLVSIGEEVKSEIFTMMFSWQR